ncbi:MAG TPA: magnesium/cobalt transporter CorA [Negativicutes bacterium]|nr:magnesium/cobalt transporter CorA [Negativicutes bacterium]
MDGVDPLKRMMPSYAGKKGFPPGTLTHVGSVYTDTIKIRQTDFGATGADSREIGRWEDLLPLQRVREIAWIEISGIHDVKAVEQIGQQFSIHPLVLEDILNTTQRPKFEEYDDYLFLVMRVPFANQETGSAGASSRKKADLKPNPGLEIAFEQVSILFGKDWVLSFTESNRQTFAPVRERIINGKGRLRGQGPDYLAYALLDVIVDQFFVVLEELGESIEFLDEELVQQPDPASLRQIHAFKRQMMYLHKAVWPVREIIGAFERCGSRFCSPETGPYLRDTYDHIIQVIDTVETYRDLISGMLDIYLSSISYRLNEVMKVLTIISTVFIPLTFIAGVYGMNFENMPELKWEYGYFLVLGLMLAVTLVMLRYFRRKKWL